MSKLLAKRGVLRGNSDLKNEFLQMAKFIFIHINEKLPFYILRNFVFARIKKKSFPVGWITSFEVIRFKKLRVVVELAFSVYFWGLLTFNLNCSSTSEANSSSFLPKKCITLSDRSIKPFSTNHKGDSGTKIPIRIRARVGIVRQIHAQSLQWINVPIV